MQDNLALQLSHSEKIYKSGILPKWIDSPEKTLAVMLAAQELGVPPMVGCREIFIVNGTVGLTGKLMLGLVLSRYPNVPIEYDQTNDACTVTSGRPGATKLSSFTFSMDDARAANLLGKPNWRTWPKEMLQWRAVAKMVKALFPECLMGAHFADEIGAVVGPEGNIVSVPQSEVSRTQDLTALLSQPYVAQKNVEEPPIVDSEPVVEEGETNLPRNWNYVVTVNSVATKHKRLCDIPVKILRSEIMFWQDKKSGKEFAEKATEYLADLKPGDEPF